MKKKITFTIVTFILMTGSFYAQEKIIPLQEITGVVTYLNKPISNVNIFLKNSQQGAKTTDKGTYIIKANKGDVLQFSFVGYKVVSILIEDVTHVLNIEMSLIVNELDEAVVKSKKRDAFSDSKRKEDRKKFSTSKGTIDPETAGFAIGYIDGEEVGNNYNNLAEAIVGKVSGVRGFYQKDERTGQWVVKLHIRNFKTFSVESDVIYDVDGVIYTEDPSNIIDLGNIKSIHILKSAAATNRYGSLGSGGVIVILTNDQYHNTRIVENEDVAKKYTNKNFYKNDAVSVSKVTTFEKSSIIKLKQFNDKNKAYSYYSETLKREIRDYSIQLSIAKMFNDYYKDSSISLQLLKNQAEIYNDNPEKLKAIAYQMQEINANAASIRVYKTIFTLRPTYAQSYRDLAHAYLEKNNFKMAWRLYMSYLLQGNDTSNLAIGDLLYNEMEWLYYNRKNQAQIKESFVPKNNSIKDFRNDLRIVVEWNTSEAEFELEFVNPDKQVYTFKHSLTANEELIINEKEMGYSSKEFLISDLNIGEWMMNINYFGNKMLDPTYFKVTVYENWGSPNQTK